MTRDAEVTVIVPIYNIAGYLVECLSGITGQTYDKLQIILVDDGSTDDSGKICDRYAEQDNRIVVIHKPNEGLVKARKTGLSGATGKYICYVDGDDWIEPDMIERLVTDMEQTDADLVISGYYCDTGTDSREIKGTLKAGLYNTETIIPTMLYTGEFYEFGISQYVWAKLFRKDMLWDVQMQVDDRISCGEDVAVTYPYILQTHKIYHSGYAGYHYRQRVDSMTSCFDEDEPAGNMKLLEYLYQTFGHSKYADILHRQLNQYAKNLLLVRHPGSLDSLNGSMVLGPYGGIPADARLIIYGAGKQGQSIYRYLKGQPSIEIVNWLDRNYEFYQKRHYKVNNPEILKGFNAGSYDFIIVAVMNQSTSDGICRYLMNMGVPEEIIRRLSRDFTDEENNILGELLFPVG